MKTRCIRHNRTYRKALGFCFSMLGVAVLSLGAAFYQTPAFVLGSELNGDGSIEYLCLGAGCDTMPGFYWAD